MRGQTRHFEVQTCVAGTCRLRSWQCSGMFIANIERALQGEAASVMHPEPMRWRG